MELSPTGLATFAVDPNLAGVRRGVIPTRTARFVGRLDMRDFPLRTRVFITAVIAAGLLGIVACVLHVLHAPDLGTHVVTIGALALLVFASETFSAALARSVATREGVSISVTMPIAMASVLILGPWGAPLVTAMVALEPRPTPWFKRFFNGGMNVLATFGAAWVYVWLHALLSHQPVEVFPGQVTFDPLQVLVPMLAATLVHEIINGILMVTVLALAERVSPWRVWFGTMAESAVPLFIYSIFGLMLAVVWSTITPLASVLVLAPLMVARWVFTMFSARQEAYESTIRSLIQAVETKDAYTRGHSERVSRASVLIGRSAGMREDRVSSLRYAGMLHDVGKLGVPTRILQKSGKLTDEEFDAIKMHPTRGREITKDLEFLGEAVEGILLHHERMDGRGYPNGLKGDEIPEFARILSVADAFDSMTTTRSYRGARSIEEALEELRRCKDTQFDAGFVEALVAAITREGWDVVDTTDQVTPSHASPAMGSDDDDPTASNELGLGLATPADAAALDAFLADVLNDGGTRGPAMGDSEGAK